MKTNEVLALELEKIGLVEMAKKAREGYYHDFLSPLEDPAMTLLSDLKKAGALSLAARHMNGEFDATLEESEEWANSQDGQDTLRRLTKKE